MIEDLSAIFMNIHIGGIGYIVSVTLQEFDHGILGIEDKIFAIAATPSAIAGNIRTVITHFHSTTCRIRGCAYIQAVSSIYIIGLPGSIGGLEKKVRCIAVITHDKYYMACTIIICSFQPGYIITRYRIAGYIPIA